VHRIQKAHRLLGRGTHTYHIHTHTHIHIQQQLNNKPETHPLNAATPMCFMLAGGANVNSASSELPSNAFGGWMVEVGAWVHVHVHGERGG